MYIFSDTHLNSNNIDMRNEFLIFHEWVNGINTMLKYCCDLLREIIVGLFIIWKFYSLEEFV